jgi:glycosyltransferase involved in cell wall biosynthesis
MSPKFSIITINLNNYLGLERTIKSVISQNLENSEYIIIDGASTDGSLDIILKYADRLDYWVSEPDTGIYNAMNKGILSAKGDYCIFMNSGDILIDNVLEEVDNLKLSEDIIVGNNYEFHDGLKILRIADTKNELTFYDFYNNTICHQAAFIKRKLLIKNGMYDENCKLVSDWLFFINQIIFNEVSVKTINLDISCVEDNGIGRSKQYGIELIKVIKTLLPSKVLLDYEVLVSQKDKIEELNSELKRFKNRFSTLDKLVSKIKFFLFRRLKFK